MKNRPIINRVGQSIHQLDYFFDEHGVSCLIALRSVVMSS